MDATTAACTLAIAIAVVGALVGTAGFSALVVRRQNHRLASLAERLATAGNDASLVADAAAGSMILASAAHSSSWRAAWPTRGSSPLWTR